MHDDPLLLCLLFRSANLQGSFIRLLQGHRSQFGFVRRAHILQDVVGQFVDLPLRDVELVHVDVLLAVNHFLDAAANFLEHLSRLLFDEKVLEFLVQIQCKVIINFLQHFRLIDSISACDKARPSGIDLL